MGPCQISDVRSQPADRDGGHKRQHDKVSPDTTAVMATLLKHQELIESCGMVCLIVDNRAPEEVIIGLPLPSGGSPGGPCRTARFLCPKVHFGVVDNNCVPVALFEVKDLVAFAESQFHWLGRASCGP